MFLSNNPSSEDINSSNLPCFIWPYQCQLPVFFLVNVSGSLTGFIKQLSGVVKKPTEILQLGYSLLIF